MKNSKTTLIFLFIIASSQTLYSQNKKGSDGTNFSAYNAFDFIPGEKTLFFDDFSKGLAQWNMIEWDLWEDSQKGRVTSSANVPGNWYFMPRKGTSQPKGLKTLPNQFTLEYDLFTDDEVSEHEGGILNIFVKEKELDINQYSYHFDGSPQIKIDIKALKDLLYLNAWREYGYTGGFDETPKIFEDLKKGFWKSNKVHRISFSRNGSHVKVYVNQDKVIDLPNALPPNEGYTLLLCNNLWSNGYYISNVRVATGFPQPAKEIKENKAFVTPNIHFEVNSDKIKPSSYQILKEIAKAIKETEGKFLIVGHTDSDGNADKNMDLSKRRSKSVKNALVNEFGIDAEKLETDGKGQTEPLDTNDTPQGKANNRRVAFVLVE